MRSQQRGRLTKSATSPHFGEWFPQSDSGLRRACAAVDAPCRKSGRNGVRWRNRPRVSGHARRWIAARERWRRQRRGIEKGRWTGEVEAVEQIVRVGVTERERADVPFAL